jgi:hypothetical protein
MKDITPLQSKKAWAVFEKSEDVRDAAVVI